MIEVDFDEIHRSCLASIYANAENIHKYLDDTKDEEFEKLRVCVQGYCDLEHQQRASQKALQKIKKDVDLESLDARYSKELAKYVSSPVNYPTHPYMIELEKHIAAAESRDEDDLVMTDGTYIDQITKLPIVNPVRNTICNHIYEESTIMDFIKGKKKKCQYPCCKNSQYILKEHLIPDEELRQTLTQQQANV